MTPREKLLQRMIKGKGVRPFGHQAPDDAPVDGPQTPAQSPVPPPVTPPSQPRVPDWWRRERPYLGAAQVPEAPEALNELKPAGDEHQEPAEPAAPAGPAAPEQVAAPTPPPSGPVEKIDVGAPKRTAVRLIGDTASGDRYRRLRIVAFNGTAAGVGWSLGITNVVAAYLPIAEQAAVGSFGLVLAAGGAWATWKVSGAGAVRAVFKEKTPILRLLVVPGAAELGRRLAPIPVAYLNAYGEAAGLGPSTVSLLITDLGICGGLWWFIDRRIRQWRWGYRWLFRVPLASALLACLPYSTGPVI